MAGARYQFCHSEHMIAARHAFSTSASLSARLHQLARAPSQTQPLVLPNPTPSLTPT